MQIPYVCLSFCESRKFRGKKREQSAFNVIALVSLLAIDMKANTFVSMHMHCPTQLTLKGES